MTSPSKPLSASDTGGEIDPVLGRPLFSWGVTARDLWLHRLGLAAGLASLLGIGLLVATSATGPALGLMVAGAAAGLVSRGMEPRRGDSFQVFERGISDGGRTLLWSELSACRFDARDEVTRVGGVETARITTWFAELTGPGGVHFVLEGTGPEAAEAYAQLKEMAGRFLPGSAG